MLTLSDSLLTLNCRLAAAQPAYIVILETSLYLVESYNFFDVI